MRRQDIIPQIEELTQQLVAKQGRGRLPLEFVLPIRLILLV